MSLAHSAPFAGEVKTGALREHWQLTSVPIPDGRGSGWYRQVQPPSWDAQNVGRPPAHVPVTQPVVALENTASPLSHANGIAPEVGRPCPGVSSTRCQWAPLSRVRKIAMPLFPAAKPSPAVTQPSWPVTMSGAEAPIAPIGTEPIRAQVRPPSVVRKMTGQARFRGWLHVTHATRAL